MLPFPTFAALNQEKSNVMALSTTSLQPTAQNAPVAQPGSDNPVASVLSAILLTAYAGQKSRKQLRKLKRQMTWLLVKQKAKSMFSRSAASERQIILYILIGILALVLVFYYPIAALVLAIIGLVLFLTGTI